MAQYYLINCTRVAGVKLFPGTLIDDATDDVAAIEAACGLLWTASNATIAAAAKKAQDARKFRGANEIKMESIMQTAVQEVQQAEDESNLNDVADGAGLSLVDDTLIPDGSRRRVLSFLQPFILDQASTATVDGVTVIATKSGSGRWLRQLEHVPRWTAQKTWYVDPQDADANGASDENDGSASAPLLTLAEVVRRLRVVDAEGYTVNLRSDTEATDSFDFCPQISGTGSAGQPSITIAGRTDVVAYTGTVKAAGATVGTTPATNTPAQIENDGEFDWNNAVGKLGMFTISGTFLNVRFAVTKAISAAIARVSPFQSRGGHPAVGVAFEAIGAAPADGDTFVILDMPLVRGNIRHAGNPNRMAITWKDVEFDPAAGLIADKNTLVMDNCELRCGLSGAEGKGSEWNAFFVMNGCAVTAGGAGVNAGKMTQFDCRTRWVGCAFIDTGLHAFNTGRMEFINSVIQGGKGGEGLAVAKAYSGFWGDTSHTSGQASVFNGADIGAGESLGLGIFDVAGVAINLVRCAFFSTDDPLYGSGNTTGIRIIDGSTVLVRDGLTPTLTGTAEIDLDGGDNVPLVAADGTPTANAGGNTITTWAGAGPTDWNGTYGRHAVNLKTGSKILSVPSSVI